MKALAATTCIALLGAIGWYAYQEVQKTDWYAEREWKAWYEAQFFKGLTDACLESRRTGVYGDPPRGVCDGYLADMPRKP